MVFWIGVLVGGLFVFIGVKIGFFATWVMLWNLVLSSYMAVFLTPFIIAKVPAATSSPHGYALVFVSVFVATLSIAYGICYACLSGQLRVDFPKMFDIAGGILGFLAGFLLWSFAGIALTLTPLSQEDSVRNLGFDASSQETNKSYLCWWCDLVHGIVGSSDSEMGSEETLGLLLEEAGAPGADSVPPVPYETQSPRETSSTPSPQGSSSQGASAQGSASQTPSLQDSTSPLTSRAASPWLKPEKPADRSQ